jgi:peptide deformylase
MSAKDNIITLPNKHLHDRSQRVGLITDAIRKVIDEMKRATLDWEASREHEVGVALAAIQIDKPLKIVVVRNNFDDKQDKTIKVGGKLEEDYEGCLSVVDVYGKVPRYTRVRIRALDEYGHEVRIKAEGFLARVLQHEIDHVNGIMFIDHIKDNPEAFYMITSEGKLEKLPYERVQKTGIFRD